jgi:F-type H+-transporting ATPase subunit gamma
MKMVAAAKLRRSQEAILSARPFAYRIYSLLLSLANREDVSHPLLVQRPEKKIKLVVLAGDRGLCGAFNSNIFKEALRFIAEKEAEGIHVQLDCIGKKANDFFKKRREVAHFHEGVLGVGTFQRAAEVADTVLSGFTEKEPEVDAVYLVYNEFKSAIQQKVIVERLIPVSLQPPEGVVGVLRASEEDKYKNYLFEPSKDELLNELVPRHFRTQVFRAILESVASEHGARMTSMENATKNASEMIDNLTLEYNKARQASITKELMEIVSGVEAMR